MTTRLLIVALILCTVSAFLALDARSAENMSFHGTLLEHPPCDINDGQPIAINFGEVGVNKVDGENYSQPFEINYTCNGARTDMILRYVGVATAFDNAAVQSSIENFGIQLRNVSSDGVHNLFVVGTAITVSSNQNLSKFVAIPVKKQGSDLPGDSFTSSAMLQLEYQ